MQTAPARDSLPFGRDGDHLSVGRNNEIITLWASKVNYIYPEYTMRDESDGV
jgi:hypothetical protein